MKKMLIKAIRPNYHSYNSTKFFIQPNKKYKISVKIKGIQGDPFSAYVCCIVLDSMEFEISRHIKWINDFSSKEFIYTIIFISEKIASHLIIGYRVNNETPVKSDVILECPDPSTIEVTDVPDDQDELFDDINNYVVPLFPRLKLNTTNEQLLEKKMVWVLGTIRSGSTWLCEQLLIHKDNEIWSEPWIGSHLDAIGGPGFEGGPVNSWGYFFSLRHKNNWLPELRKLILQRAYSQVQTIDKNIIIKEPTAAGVSNILMECFPNSKLVFLLRDPRDVVDSIIDAHKKNSWNKDVRDKPLSTKEDRFNAIDEYSNSFTLFIEKVWNAYQIHNPKLRLLVKYEDLRTDTFTELKKIYDFLNISITDEVLMKKIDRYDFNKIPSSSKGSGKITRSATPGGWKKNFNDEEKNLMNSIMKSILKKTRYTE